MTLTAVFTDYKLNKVTGPRGGVKWESKKIEVVDTLHPIEISFGSDRCIFYTRGRDTGSRFKMLYWSNGTFATGIWQHGKCGSKRYQEPIELRDGKLVTCSSYASGQIKDQHKYLLSIIPQPA